MKLGEAKGATQMLRVLAYILTPVRSFLLLSLVGVSTEAFDFSVEWFVFFFFGFLFVYFLFCFVVLAEKDLLQGEPKRQADSCPKKPRAPQRVSAKYFKKSGENSCTPVVDSCQCMAKPIQYCKAK